MKQSVLMFLLLVVGLFSVSFVAAEVDESDYYEIDFDNYDDDEMSPECAMKFQHCANLVDEYLTSGVYETAETVRQAGLRGVCKDVTELSECVLKVFLSEECANDIPAPYKEIYQKGHDLTNFICVDRINDIETHWQCLLNTEVDENLEDCQNVDIDSLKACDTSGVMKCVKSAFGASSHCEPGASDLVEDIIQKAVDIIPHCSDRRKLHKVVMKLLKRK